MYSHIWGRTVIRMLSTKAIIRLSKRKSRIQDCRWSGHSIFFVVWTQCLGNRAKRVFWAVFWADLLGSSKKWILAIYGFWKDLESSSYHLEYFGLLKVKTREEQEQCVWLLRVLAQKWHVSLPVTACWQEVDQSTSCDSSSMCPWRGGEQPLVSTGYLMSLWFLTYPTFIFFIYTATHASIDGHN